MLQTPDLSEETAISTNENRQNHPKIDKNYPPGLHDPL